MTSTVVWLILFDIFLQQDLLQKISALEIENQSNIEKLEKELHDKAEEIGTLMKESENHKKRADMLEIEGDQLHNILKEKEEFILLFNEREKKLEEQNKEVLYFVLLQLFTFMTNYCD